MKHVLVTGAAGFIGSHLTESLVREGYSVRALYHYNARNDTGWLADLPSDIQCEVEMVSGDVCDPFAMAKAMQGQDAVLHLASLIAIPYSYVAPASYVSTNVSGTLNVLQASLDADVSLVVHTSTSETYGTAQYTPMDEAHPQVAQSPYSATKIAADKLAESFHRSFGLPVVTIRPFNTYGPRQSMRAIIPTIVSQALAGASEIRLGSLRPVRDMNYVDDTVAGFLAALSSPAAVGATINLGSGKGVSIETLAKTLLRLCGSEAGIVTEERRLRPEQSEVYELVCDACLARKLLGWQPAHSLEQGLSKTVDWISRNMQHYKHAGYTI